MYLFTLWKQKNIGLGLELINLNMPMHRGKIWLSTLIFYVSYGESTGSTCIFLKRACAAPLILASKSFFSSVLCWTTDSSILLERFCLFMPVSLDACLFNYASLHSICKASWPQKKKLYACVIQARAITDASKPPGIYAPSSDTVI